MLSTLSLLAGLDIDWASNGTLVFGDDILVEETLTRPLERLRSVALEPTACTPGDRIQYWMYKGICRRRDRERIAMTGMRYGVTLMFPHAIGRERAKTLGHLHTRPSNGSLDFPAVCEVLYGKAYFVFQTLDPQTRTASLCGYTEAGPGDKVVIPPNMHHLTINASDEPLLFADVIPREVKGIYQPLADMRGAAWLNTRDEAQGAGWIKNPSYRTVADLEEWPVLEYPDFKLTCDQPLYQTFVKSPELLLWMMEPMSFPDMFPDVWDRMARVVRVT